jgi:hypothetical protein
MVALGLVTAALLPLFLGGPCGGGGLLLGVALAGTWWRRPVWVLSGGVAGLAAWRSGWSGGRMAGGGWGNIAHGSSLHRTYMEHRYGKGQGGMVRAWLVGMALLQVVTSVFGGPAGRAYAAAATGYEVLYFPEEHLEWEDAYASVLTSR